MDVKNGRPIIESVDRPDVVRDALDHSILYYNEHGPQNVAFAWSKTAQDATGAIDDAFGLWGGGEPMPERSTIIFMSLGQLELALVAYGVDRIGKGLPIVEVDALLCSIDGLRAQMGSRR
jgi:hypothetical protein